MRDRISILTIAIALTMLMCLTAFGQTAALNGAVTDPNGEVVAGATVQVKNSVTGEEFKATTSGNGTFSIPALAAGTYTVTLNAKGFKQAVVNEVKLDVGTPANVRVALEVGNTSESVVIQGGGEIVQSQSANISTTLNVNQNAADWQSG